MKKKLVTKYVRVLLAAILVAVAHSPISEAQAMTLKEENARPITQYSENANLTQEQVQERFQKINSTYRVGESFNDSDSDFIERYATSASALRGSYSFSGGRIVNNTAYQYSGSMWHNGIVNYTYGIDGTFQRVNSGPLATMVYCELHFTSYGFNPQGSYCIAYDRVIGSSGANTAWFNLYRTATYMGATVFFYMETHCDFSLPSGNYTISFPISIVWM